MLKRHHRIFQSVQVLRDTLTAGLAFVVAFGLRFHTGLLPFDTPANQQETVVVGLMVLLAWPVVGWLSQLYISHRTRPWVAEVFDVFKVSTTTFLVVVTVTYFLRDERYSRSVMGLWWPVSFVLISGVRLLSRFALHSLRRRGLNLRHVMLVGTGNLAREVHETILRRSAMGLRLVGFVAHDDDRALVGSTIDDKPVLGTASSLSNILAASRAAGREVDQVLVALEVDRLGALKPIMEILSQETVDVRLIPDVYQYVTLCGSVEEFSGMPVITLQSTPLTGWSLAAKRLFDVVTATAALVIAAPLMLLVAGLIKLTSPGPVFFRQVRVGLDGETFTMIKFRTMRVDAEAAGAATTTPQDPRCTPLGRWLRRLSLDELPQLWNVVRGDMSLVGPRPEQPAFINDFKRQIPRYALRHKIKSGMTGLAQVNGMRGNTSISQRIELDLYYIENWSLLLDVKILLRTVLGGFLSRHAY